MGGGRLHEGAWVEYDIGEGATGGAGSTQWDRLWIPRKGLAGERDFEVKSANKSVSRPSNKSWRSSVEDMHPSSNSTAELHIS